MDRISSFKLLLALLVHMLPWFYQGCTEAFTFQPKTLSSVGNVRHIYPCSTKNYRISIRLFRRSLHDLGVLRKVNGLLPVSSLLRELRGNTKQLKPKQIISAFSSLKPLFMGANGNKDGLTKEAIQNEILLLKQENKLLRENVAVLEQENRRLERQGQNRIVIEQFEGEGKQMVEPWWDEDDHDMAAMTLEGERLGNGTMVVSRKSQNLLESQPVASTDDICTEWNEDNCPIEPDISFNDALRDRAYWLVGLLVMQSLSGIILSRNEELLRSHPVIVYFLTMLVGAGGNAGNQASVRVIRGLALGTLNENSQKQFLSRELRMAVSLSSILSLAGFVRASLFRTPFAESIAVTAALALIVFSSVCLGALLPLFLKKIDVDPAHSSTTIQVIMDILGVILTVVVSNVMLDSRLGQFIISRLPF